MTVADTVLEVLATTRAIRRYRPGAVPDADLNRILFTATRAPSGSNRQPFRFLVLRNGPSAPAARALLGRCYRAAWSRKAVNDGYVEPPAPDSADSPKARVAATMQHYVDHLEAAPVVVLACLVRYRAPDPREGASVYPACQNLLVAARALGYGGVLTGWHGEVEDELRALLGIPDEVTVAAVITLGVPAGRHGPVRRKPLRELVYEGRWGEPAPWAEDPPGTRHTGPRDPGTLTTTDRRHGP